MFTASQPAQLIVFRTARPILDVASTALADFTDYSVRPGRRTLILGGTYDGSICGFGGMGLSAGAVDKRIKAVVITSMDDMSRMMANGYYDSRTKEQRTQMLEAMSRQRWADAEQGFPAPGSRILPETLDGTTDPVTRMYFDYYRTPRGFHPRSPNSNGAWTATAPMSFMNLPLLTYVAEMSPRPLLLIAGDKAHSRHFSEDAYRAAAQPKELMIIDDANHVDLYDRLDKIPFNRISEFFGKNLRNESADSVTIPTCRVFAGPHA